MNNRADHYRPLDRYEIKAIEDKVDHFFLRQTMPGRTEGEARWLLLTATEDALRLVFAQSCSAWVDPAAFSDRATFIYFMDRYKYNLKYSLDLVQRAGLPKSPVSFKRFGEDGTEYLLVNRVLNHEAALYANAVGTFTSIWGGHRVALGKANREVLELDPLERELQYRSLDALCVDHSDGFTPIPLLALVFFASSNRSMPNGDSIEWSPSLKAIVASVKARNGSATYQFVNTRGADLFQLLTHDPEMLPRDWLFPWADRDEATRFSIALLAICAYHIIAIHFGAQRHRLPGIGLNDVCLTIKPKELSKRITAISGLDDSISENIIAALTLGNKVNSPDPALQPLIPVAENLISIPCMMIMTNHWSRNMLALHARVASKSFDAQSHFFEEQMIEEITSHSNGYDVHSNKHVSLGSKREEIDLIYIDGKSKTLLACELRWAIPPGDPREVYHRKTAVSQKVIQIERKSKGIVANMASALESLGVEEDGKLWTVRSLVIVDGYTGHLSSDPARIPIVPKAVFTKLLSMKLTLDQLHEVLSSPLWLPRPGIDFSIVASATHLGSVEIKDKGYSPISDHYLGRNLAKYVQDALHYSNEALSGLVW